MEKDNLYFGKDGRERMMAGIRKAADAVGLTLGTSGANSLLECLESPGHYATNDGATILQNIKFADPLEEMGRRILYEAVSRANRSSGDGSSTTCVLTAAILEEGMKYLDQSYPMGIKHSLEDCISKIERILKKNTQKIRLTDIASVASISAEDENIGNTIQEIYKKIGKDGIIQWEAAKTPEDSYTITSGLRIEGTKFITPYLGDFDNASGWPLSEVRLKEVPVVLCRQKITDANVFSDLFSVLYDKDHKNVLLFCDEIDISAVAAFIKTRQKNGFRVALVKMPVIFNNEWWEDLAVASGAKIISPEGGVGLNDLNENVTGSFGNVRIAKEDTYVDGIKDLAPQIHLLESEDSEQSRIRIARLNTKTARYFVGAHSESALAYKRLKVEDAINAASCAIRSGVVIGGGVALYNAARYLSGKDIGGKILKEALKNPLRRIVYNAGAAPESVEKHISKKRGFNSRTRRIENLLKGGVVDPLEVVLNAVKNAIGVAASVLTAGTVVLLPKEDQSATVVPVIQR